MNRLRLTHLTMVGPSIEKASVDFNTGLTVIYGASDTGKSYIAQAIDYMLGGRKLKEDVPEAEGYSHVILGMLLPDGSPITLIRATNGGRFNVYFSEVHDIPDRRADQVLSASHNARSLDNLSQFLLAHLGITGALVRKNAQNECQQLSFRNLARLCLIDETDMQSAVSPTLSGQVVNETVEKSVFKFLVEGQDDSDIAAAEESADQRRVSKGKAELLSQLIADLEASIRDSPDLRQLEDQHIRVRAALDEHSQAVSEVIARRDGLLEQHDSIRSSMDKDRIKLSEVQNLSARFGLLRQQYESDMARLEMVTEAGDLLGYFDRGICIFCGAALEDQRAPSMHVAGEATELATAVNAERAKTVALNADLEVTLNDVGRQAEELQSSLAIDSAAIDDVNQKLSAVEEELAPKNQLLSQLLEARSSIERAISAYEQIDKLEALRTEIEPGELPTAEGPRFPTSGVLARFSGIVSSLLSKWEVPDGHPVELALGKYDLIVAGQPRSSRGKGIRAILHAAYTLGLAQYCDEMQLPHPGFVILDSPLITYRGPDEVPVLDSESGDHVSESVAAAFFRHVAGSHGGQVIVLENTDPPSDIYGQANIVLFTKRTDMGRYGFFPR